MKKELILYIILIAMLIIVTIGTNTINKKAVNDCMNAGHSRAYCEKVTK